MVTTNITILSKVELSMNKMNKKIISVMPTIIHKHRTKNLEDQMNLIKITSTMTTTTMTTITKVKIKAGTITIMQKYQTMIDHIVFSLKIIFIKVSYINYCIGHLSANIDNNTLCQ